MAARPSMELVPDVLAGDTVGIARLLSRAEAGGEESQPALAEIFRHTNGAHIVGITGVPGSGKSTLVSSLTRAIRKAGRKVGIVAIDPTSPFSGGAILGDRIRMSEVAQDPGVFIRSMATRGVMGGLSKASLDAVDILDAAGFDVVLIETVGVGQDEVEIVQAAHSVVVVSAPGLGDDIQAIKAGVLEIADIHVVNKCDRPDANDAVRSLRMMLKLGVTGNGGSKWDVPVIRTSVVENEGIDRLWATIDRHRTYLKDSGEMVKRCRKIVERRMLKTAEDIIRDRFAARRHDALSGILDRVVARDLDPNTAAHQLLAALNEE